MSNANELYGVVLNTPINPNKFSGGEGGSIVAEATVTTGGINQIAMDETTFNNIVKEGLNRITLVLSDDVIFKGESWYFGTYYKSLYYFNGTAWVDVQTLSGSGYSKGQSMELECKVQANGGIEYVHILNLPSPISFILEALPKAEGMTV